MIGKYTLNPWSITRPTVLLMSIGVFILSLLILILAIACFLRIKKRRSKEWGVFKKHQGPPFLKDAILSDKFVFPTRKPFEQQDGFNINEGFSSLPPVQIHPKFLESYQIPINYPEDKLDSISVNNLPVYNENRKKSVMADPHAPVQAPRYISPTMEGGYGVSAHVNDLRSFESTSHLSNFTNKTAYV
ncbi:hypothetical protein RF11_02246 [Thelohanellus kitauei]|uniref:Uncharacterized protein n=1 Tax=Thelohanellus kitauei TaxID=669202 RepID=A0A0C2J2Y1_THEKT|nr:hypothetical protein RF11_02246 [Thelohanellus kitauei]